MVQRVRMSRSRSRSCERGRTEDERCLARMFWADLEQMPYIFVFFEPQGTALACALTSFIS